MLAVAARETAILRAGIVVVAGVDVRGEDATVRRVRVAEVQRAGVAVVAGARFVCAAVVLEILRGVRLRVAHVDRARVGVVAEVLGRELREHHTLVALRERDAGRVRALDRRSAVLVGLALVGLAGVRTGAGRPHVFIIGVRLSARPALIGGGVLRVRRGVGRVRDVADVGGGAAACGEGECENERQNKTLHDFPPQENGVSLSTWRSAMTYFVSRRCYIPPSRYTD